MKKHLKGNIKKFLKQAHHIGTVTFTKKLVKEYTNNGSADMGQLYGLLHDELAQYANTLVGTALKHFLVDDHSSKKD